MKRPNYRTGMRVRFTPELWQKWLSRMNRPHPDGERLEAGIKTFRKLCAAREKGLS